MRLFLTILFILLYVGNEIICVLVYPDVSTHDVWLEYDALKKQINEVIFGIALLIPLCKKSFISKLFIYGAVMLVLGSIIDKIQGLNQYHFHDIVLIIGSFVICRQLYIKYKNYVEQ